VQPCKQKCRVNKATESRRVTNKIYLMIAAPKLQWHSEASGTSEPAHNTKSLKERLEACLGQLKMLGTTVRSDVNAESCLRVPSSDHPASSFFRTSHRRQEDATGASWGARVHYPGGGAGPGAVPGAPRPGRQRGRGAGQRCTAGGHERWGRCVVQMPTRWLFRDGSFIFGGRQ
jgi:hypothetical protein